MKKKLRERTFTFFHIITQSKELYVFLIFCFISCSTYATIYAQNQTITIKKTNSTILSIMREIEAKSGLTFCFNDNQIDINKSISINLEKVTIEKALDETFRNTGYKYRIVGKQIIITENSESNGSASTNQLQTKKKISGMVLDKEGEPIIGANIKEVNTSNGVITDINGYFTIFVSPKAILEVSYIGYKKQSIVVNNRSIYNIVLQESDKTLDEVVVIGYGQQKKSSVVASINSIDAAQLTVKSSNLTTGIAGKLPGVISVQRSGEPGNDGAAFFIRGQSSYGGGTNPLILVDGIPRAMKDIDVDEIESFTVLKDAAATAVYGAEGANGVVLITSKRGKIQKTQIDISAQYNIVTPTRMMELLPSYDYLKLYDEARWNDAGNPENFIPEVADDILEKYQNGSDFDLYPNVNWMDLLKTRTQSQRYTISFRGGTDKVRYFTSGVYYSEDGIFKSNAIEKYNANIGLQRFNLRSNIDIDLTNTTLLSVDMSGQYMRKNNPGFSTDDIFFAISRYPVHVIPMIYSDGSFSDAGNGGWGMENQPYNMLNNSGYTKTWGAFLQTKITLDQKLDFITKGLSVKGIISFDADFSSSMTRSKTPKTFYATKRVNDELEKQQIKSGSELTNPTNSGTSGQKKIYLEASLNYQHTFGDKHDVTGLLLYMQKESQFQTEGGLKMLPYRKQSMVSRVSYSFDTRYMIEASMGMTGSENFASGHRWGIFPAVGAAWYVSHEKFMRGNISKYISTLKLRASYGITGNDNIGDNRFPYRESINVDAPSYNLGLSPGAGGGANNNPGAGIVEGSIAMPYLTWEKEKKVNLGIDLGLFDGRVYLSADYFSNRRSDILLQRRTILDVTGMRTAPYQNFGVTTNKGFDGNLTLKQKIGELSISALGNFTYAKNKVLEYDEVPPRYAYQSVTGFSMGKPWLYIAEGLYTPDDFNITIDPTTGAHNYTLKSGYAKPAAAVKPGDIKYKDVNGDEIINDYDKTTGNRFYSGLPEIVYGFGLNLEWKGLFVGVFFQGTGHASVNLMENQTAMMPFTIGKDKSSARTLLQNRWSAKEPYNQNVLYPRVHSGEFSHNSFPSTWWYRDASFLRFKNMEIGYDFNTKLLQKLKINNLRVYFQGDNLAVWDKVKYWDPELDPYTSGAKYPLCRTYTIGLDITF